MPPDPKPSATVEMEITKTCFVSEASVPYLPRRADNNTPRKLDKGKVYILTKEDARAVHKAGLGRKPWNEAEDNPAP